MPPTSYIFKASIAVFLINTAGRFSGVICNSVELDMIGVALSFVAAFCAFYACLRNKFERIVVSFMMGYVILQAVKEIAGDATVFYPFEFLSIVPVLLTIYNERKKLKTPAAHNKS